MLLKFKNFVNENKKRVYEYSCAMVYYDFPQLKKIQNIILKKDLTDIGFEDEPHTTILYGLHDNEVDKNLVIETCLSEKIEDLKLYNISLFENEDYDVLKFDVDYYNDNHFLHKINKKLVKMPHTNDYPKYHPHSTIAYLKPGKGAKYVKQLKNKEYKVIPTSIVYSRANGTKIKKTIN